MPRPGGASAGATTGSSAARTGTRVDRTEAPPRAPVPDYQRVYRGRQYPPAERQPEIRTERYRYQPQEPVVRDHYEREDDHAHRGRRGPQAVAFGIRISFLF